MLARPRMRLSSTLAAFTPSVRLFSSSPLPYAPKTTIDQILSMADSIVQQSDPNVLEGQFPAILPLRNPRPPAHVRLSHTDSTSVLKHLRSNTVISPGHLSPTHMLEPYLPRPNYSLAYPLGPPVSEARSLDPFVRLGLDPRASPMNPYLRTEYCTSMGKIKSRGKTSLQRGSQRKMGKAVRRARSMGIAAVFGKSVPTGN
ncbi:hypothetical protein P7C70_g2482, partial [Phenoliferia sp. Uapishka_3]